MRAHPFAIGLILCTIGGLHGLGTLQIPHACAQQMSVSLKSSRSAVEPQQTFVYSVTVRNEGNEVVEGMTVSLSIDKRLAAQSASDNGRTSNGKVEWREIALAAGQSRTFTASVRVDAKAEDGARLYATAVAGGGFAEATVQVEDENDTGNDDERAITVRLYSNKAQVEPGEPLSLIVQVQNRGEKRASNVEVTVELAEHLAFLSASNQGKSSGRSITWKGLSIEKNDERTVTVSTRVEHSAAHGGSLISTAYAEGAVHEHRISVWDPSFGRERMQLHMFTDAQEVEAGGKLTYTLRVRNLAGHDEQADILAYIDPRSTVTSVSGDGQQFEQNLVVWERVSFSQNETQSFTLAIQVPETLRAGEALRFSAQAGLDRRELVTRVLPSRSGALVASALPTPPDRPPAPAAPIAAPAPQQPAPVPASAIPAITLTLAADRTESQPGSSIAYTISVTNAGGQTVRDLHVQESFPAGTVEVLDADNGTRIGSSVQWMIPALEAGRAWSATYRIRTSSSLAHGSIVMSAVTVRDGGNSVLAHADRRMNIISALPQAGWGAFVAEAAAAKEHIRIVQPAMAQKQATALVRTTGAQAERESGWGRRIAWGAALSLGTFLGILIAIVAAQNTLFPEKPLSVGRTPANA
ncbi:MAG: hypothetical protein PHO92_05460 [Candidatus Peribacteraceae bacterium]|nr:hypothetical protein [Candidatus Peribacteraceae bacterium]